jgi:hypothetical protein
MSADIAEICGILPVSKPTGPPPTIRTSVFVTIIAAAATLFLGPLILSFRDGYLVTFRWGLIMLGPGWRKFRGRIRD